jgi:hypothetical protein
MFDDSRQTSVTVQSDPQSGFRVTVNRHGTPVTLGVRYRTEADAMRAGNEFLAEWERTGRLPGRG